MISIVVPAHDEEAVIGRLLTPLASADDLEVVVVCNGCADGTASEARRHGVTVVETAIASKTAALNLGDEAVGGFPRFYVDADVEIGPESVRRVAAVLAEGKAMAAAPRMVVDLAGAGWPVRAFYDIWQRLPYRSQHPVGTGVYALSEEGRARFGRFPDIISDDGYVRALFAPGDRVTVEEATFTVHPPRTVAGLVAIKTRVHKGRMELADRFPELAGGEPSTGRAFLGLGRSPALWAKMAVYAYVMLTARRRAVRKYRAGDQSWERDESSRTG